MKRSLFILVLALATSLQGKVLTIAIPNQEWKIAIDAPPLTILDENHVGNGPTFSATSGNFNVTVFVEEPQIKAGGTRDCYQYYWGRIRQNPLIKPETAKVSLVKSFYRVEYQSEAAAGSSVVRQRNVNYYIAHQNHWIDVHISVSDPSAADETVIAAFDQGLKIEAPKSGAEQAPKGQPAAPAGSTIRELSLSDTISLNLSVPANWQLDEVTQPTPLFPYLTFPLRPVNGNNAAVLMTVYTVFKEKKKTEDAVIRKLLIGDCTPWIARSVGRRMAEIHPIIFAHGHGLYANFVDASLVGKPPIKKNYKISTCFIISLEDQYLMKITVFCDDLSSGDYRDALAMIKSLAEPSK